MIYDKVENMGIYFNNLPNFEKVPAEYRKFIESPFNEGRIDIDGDNLWCNVASYEVNPDNPLKYEAHKEYADVQIMVDGEELFGWANTNECIITEDFKEGCDIAFMDAPNGQFFALRKGYFAVFFPEDAHAPCRKSENADTAHKLVFKVKL
ncbi:MAG: YhcH/YjgK/YiaL family protein [Clostridia bacterium]|nr:YhcH/YjgK/YiaL family protein [Clostridia bacterium]